MAGAGFDWKNIILNFITVIGLGGIITAFTGIILGPLSLALLGLGVGLFQADGARKEIVKAAKKELIKHIPQVAAQQRQPVYDAIKECFDNYEEEVMSRIDDDIEARKAELENLVQQKESREIDSHVELQRLQQLVGNVQSEYEGIEMTYQEFSRV